MKTIYLIIALLFGIIVIAWSNWKTNIINNYWDTQFEICGKVGWYELDGECVPVKEMQNVTQE